VTNIDREHMDCYRDMQDVERTFIEFMDRVPFYGMVVACWDNQPLRTLLPRVQRRVVTYGLGDGADFRISAANNTTQTKRELELGTQEPQVEPSSTFEVTYRGRNLGEFHLRVPGAHNILNATAAIAVGIGLDINTEDIRRALDEFRGVDRRFQFKGSGAGVTVIDDYGHHPTEIKATLAAAKECGYRRVLAVFQPHRYTRTQLLMEDFAEAFRDADAVFMLDIYAASETPIAGVTSQVLAARVRDRCGKAAEYVASFDDAVEAIAKSAQAGDMVLTLGAGNVSQLGPLIVDRLSATY
jgi:UDP-N-acetylmuramate--alanine ligase